MAPLRIAVIGPPATKIRGFATFLEGECSQVGMELHMVASVAPGSELDIVIVLAHAGGCLDSSDIAVITALSEVAQVLVLVTNLATRVDWREVIRINRQLLLSVGCSAQVLPMSTDIGSKADLGRVIQELKDLPQKHRLQRSPIPKTSRKEADVSGKQESHIPENSQSVKTFWITKADNQLKSRSAYFQNRIREARLEIGSDIARALRTAEIEGRVWIETERKPLGSSQRAMEAAYPRICTLIREGDGASMASKLVEHVLSNAEVEKMAPTSERLLSGATSSPESSRLGGWRIARRHIHGEDILTFCLVFMAVLGASRVAHTILVTAVGLSVSLSAFWLGCGVLGFFVSAGITSIRINRRRRIGELRTFGVALTELKARLETSLARCLLHAEADIPRCASNLTSRRQMVILNAVQTLDC